MPTYEYECLECKHRFDVFQSMKDDPISICEKCQGNVRKRFNSTGIIFKGSGFYVNDYKKNSSESSTRNKTDNEVPSKKEKASKAESSSTDSSIAK